MERSRPVNDLRQHVEAAYADLWVEGEISNCRAAPSGHVYFTLKDGEAQLPVVLFRRQAQLLRFQPQDGLAVLVRGRVSVYESRGQLQLIAETLEPRGTGALQLAYEQLKARLLAEGLFDAARKRPLPAFPRSVGVITSTSGAVLHDIVRVIRRRHARLNLLVYPATVQGPECAASVAAGIRWFNQIQPKQSQRRKSQPVKLSGMVDLILIARGGGPLEDLAGFNDEALARAIAASALPVVSAIGHETDFTIADFVADLRAATPSAAAELSPPPSTASRSASSARRTRPPRRPLSAYAGAAALHCPLRRPDTKPAAGPHRPPRSAARRPAPPPRLSPPTAACARAPASLRPSLRGSSGRTQPSGSPSRAAGLEAASQSLNRLARTTIAARAARLDRATARLDALSPLAVLNRGYALVYAADGRLLRDASEARPGQTIRARLAHGSVTAEVKSTGSA